MDLQKLTQAVVPWLALAVAAATQIENRLRYAAERREAEDGRLQLVSETFELDALLVHVRYDPPSAHTSYGAHVEGLGDQLVSYAFWRQVMSPISDREELTRAPMTPASRALRLDLEPAEGGVIGHFIAEGAKRRRVRVKIYERGSGRRVARRTVFLSA